MKKVKVKAEVKAEVKEPDTEKPKDTALDERIKSTIDAMTRNVSVDFNKHQIQASVYGRLEKWAAKNGIEDWDSRLPKYVSFVKECAEARHSRVQNFMERKRQQKENKFSDSLHDAIYGG